MLTLTYGVAIFVVTAITFWHLGRADQRVDCDAHHGTPMHEATPKRTPGGDPR